MRQLLLSPNFRIRLEHGGSLSAGRRKQERPLDTKRALHVVMRSSLAEGSLSFHTKPNMAHIERSLKETAHRFGIRVYRYSINSNHVHLLIMGRTRGLLQSFLRALPGIIARRITGARRGRPFGRFWDGNLFTRIVNWGRAFTIALDYVRLNILETQGLVPYRKRPRRKESKTARKTLLFAG